MPGLAPLAAAPGPQLVRREARDIAAEYMLWRALPLGATWAWRTR
jgi:hypothetical protein